MANIVSAITIAEAASLIGDVARANMLMALMDGRALSASDLAWRAGVSAQTASGHLSKLAAGQLVVAQKRGRHRYYRLYSPEIAALLENLSVVAAAGPRRYRPAGPGDALLIYARTCYDHLAGVLGVALADRLRDRGYLSPSLTEITGEGMDFFLAFGLDLNRPRLTRRPLCRSCLDWSERRPHVAGVLGARICEHFFAAGWIERVENTRAVLVTERGRTELARSFGVVADGPQIPAIPSPRGVGTLHRPDSANPATASGATDL